jgi:hypothetical protein
MRAVDERNPTPSTTEKSGQRRLVIVGMEHIGRLPRHDTSQAEVQPRLDQVWTGPKARVARNRGRPKKLEFSIPFPLAMPVAGQPQLVTAASKSPAHSSHIDLRALVGRKAKRSHLHDAKRGTCHAHR